MDIARLGVHESVDIDFPPPVLRDALSDVDPTLAIVNDDPDALAECDAVVTFEHRDAFLDAGLAWVHTTAAGVDDFPLERYEERGVALTNSTGIHGESVGETTVGFMLLLARRLHAFVANQQAHEWVRPEWDEAFTLSGESACVVGLGTVGGGIAERAAALGMTVTGIRRSPEPAPGVEEVYAPDALREVIAEPRFVVLAVPLTDETAGLIGERELEAMREDAYLVNVARGAVVDEAALVAAIRDGGIAGAALDVFEEEPLPPDSPLWDLDDVVVSPHAAVADRDFYADIAALVRENVGRIAAGDELTNRVA